MVGTRTCRPVKTISLLEYEWQTKVLTPFEVEKLKRTDHFKKFVSNPCAKLKSAEPEPLSPPAWVFVLAVLALLSCWYFPVKDVAYRITEEERPMGGGEVEVIEPIRLWAEPLQKRGLAYERISVRVPSIPLAVQVVPVHLMCGFGEWVHHVGNQTTLQVPLPEAGDARLCVKDEREIVDLSETITVCGVTYVNAPVAKVGRSFEITVQGVCLEGEPTLSVLPTGESSCARGKVIKGRITDTGWSFTHTIDVGSVTGTCVKTVEGWVQLPRLVVLGATAYTSSKPELRKPFEITVSGIGMEANPQLIFTSNETSCRNISLAQAPTEVRLLSAGPTYAHWTVDLANYKDPMHSNHSLVAGMRMIICIGWRGSYYQVGEPIMLENDVPDLARNMLASLFLVLVGVVLLKHEWGWCTTNGDTHEPSPNTCAICWQNSTDIVFMNCGHVCACTDCSSRCSICPICRQVIRKRQKLYFS